MAHRKSWAEKMQTPGAPKVVLLDKAFAGVPPGGRVLIATPALVKEWIDAIPAGSERTVRELREELADRFEADVACPLTTGILLRIVAEAALEEVAAGKPADAVTPFWRVVDPKSPLARKLPCGPEFLRDLRRAEGAG